MHLKSLHLITLLSNSAMYVEEATLISHQFTTISQNQMDAEKVVFPHAYYDNI